ncbi:hypothetical protein OHB41_07790 [Streptomyces sp. NBC_01571]|uniref:hypothetical protein n=1 Tax=Streptomyces sp. NBC_01571 TaxID=2975883 RepID=UPI002252EC48|nr:hypothetical protein [Streptomyces sp. NBC_01571]MCX4573087.1 hypothetical protein [Streptomyces sp. NBC_01571]
MSDPSRTAAARAATKRYAAERNASDPVKLGKAVRVVQAALERRTLDLTDLLPWDGAAPVETRSGGGERR